MPTNPRKRIFEGRDKELERASQGSRTPLQRQNLAKQPRQFGGYSARTGKSPLDRECVVGLRGLELRAKHAVAIEPVSRE